MIGMYVPGTSVLHRMPAGAKLPALAVLVVLAAAAPGWPWLAGGAVFTAALFALARIPASALWRQLRPLAWIVAITLPINWIFTGFEHAVTVALRIAVCVALAALVTLTTRVGDMLDAVQRGLSRVPRVDAERIGLLLAMTIRAVPLIAEIVHAVLEARRARGAEGSLRAVAVPVVLRALQAADAMGEALIARGADD
ncbi:energy-coupling factor transporter transmembrane component T family protein [Agromyces archimandritae]|uniref:Energy-coupling factor transporter transmembrane protein EcfT n=1 Tax=Agromyces archimandritae TaxID=2781962 RepID=A0A975FMA5_9MICO|nr:energy-coupling factor transporter transmembrane protein EcfT [Agromyces archimandritae]QTX04337.1 energy-coupling factor transporter transmembrane protein EcfT [Agromyces archimandritae]